MRELYEEFSQLVFRLQLAGSEKKANRVTEAWWTVLALGTDSHLPREIELTASAPWTNAASLDDLLRYNSRKIDYKKTVLQTKRKTRAYARGIPI